MLGNMNPTMILIFMAVLFVIAIGLMVWTLRYASLGGKDKSQTKPKDEDAASSPQERISLDQSMEKRDEEIGAPAPSAPTEIPDSLSVDTVQPSIVHPTPNTRTREVTGMISLMQVWQDQDGALVIEVNGQQYRRLFDVRDGNVGRLILDTIGRLLAFSKGQVPPTAAAPVQFVSPSLVVTGDTDAVIGELRSSPEEPSVRKRPSFSMDPIPGRRRDPVRERMEAGLSLNLAEEIDKILQVHVKVAPLYQSRYIHVVEALDGSLCFIVDDNRYDGVDQVPDLAVRQMIQLAIKEWEQKR